MHLARKVANFFAAEEDLNELDLWRERILTRLLRLVLVLGAVTAIPAIYVAFVRGPGLVTLIDAVALGWIAVLTMRPGISFRIRAYSVVTLNYIIGVWFLLSVGVVSQVYLLAFPIFTALFLGLWPAIAALGLNAVTLIVIGFFVRADLHIPGLESKPLLKWVVISMNFTFVDIMLTVACGMLLQKLHGSFHSRRVATETLEAKRSELAVTNSELALEIAVRKEAEEQTNRLGRAVEQASETILMSDAEGRITYANRAFEILSGRARAFMPILWLQQLSPAGKDTQPVSAIIEKQQQWQGLVEFAGSDGIIREMQTIISPSRNSNGEVTNFVAVMRDITRERQYEARLRQSEKLEAIGTLAGGIAHDFNNIIASILGIAELKQAELRNTSFGSGMETIVLACIRARDIVRQMMVFSTKNSLERSATSLKTVVEETLSLLRAAIPSNVEIQCELTSDAFVCANPAEIQQIVMNLGGNAFHAMSQREAGTLRISVKSMQMDEDLAVVYPRLQSGHTYACLEVSDNGKGIKPENLKNIFDPFFTTKTARGGTGLGLASVHNIVTSLGGEITVTTELDKGTTFRIYLAETERSAEAPQPEMSPQIGGEGRILVVDDEPSLLQLAKRLLDGSGYSATTAQSGEAALAVFTSDPFYFDLIITDLTMSGLSGAELIRRLKKMRPDMPAILTSGFANVDGKGQPDIPEHAAYLPKPYTRQELLAKVTAALKDR